MDNTTVNGIVLNDSISNCKSVRYHVYARNCDGEINEISYEELIRFNQFLTNFLKGEEGSHE